MRQRWRRRRRRRREQAPRLPRRRSPPPQPPPPPPPRQEDPRAEEGPRHRERREQASGIPAPRVVVPATSSAPPAPRPRRRGAQPRFPCRAARARPPSRVRACAAAKGRFVLPPSRVSSCSGPPLMVVDFDPPLPPMRPTHRDGRFGDGAGATCVPRSAWCVRARIPRRTVQPPRHRRVARPVARVRRSGSPPTSRVVRRPGRGGDALTL